MEDAGQDIARAFLARLARTAAAETPAEAQFRQQLLSSVAKVALYEDAALQAQARAVMPVADMYNEALERCQRDRQPGRVMDDFLRLMLRWFKSDFFKWVNTLACERCGGASSNIGAGQPTPSELQWGGSRVELHRCNACANVMRFPRYNHPGKLLETRRGRCGEWANCFTLLCRACGYDARFVHDWTDHVWTEVFSVHQNRWLHTDCSEDNLDRPLMYEAGWNKKLSYVIAFSRDEVVDVIDRYTQRFGEVAARRTHVSERWLKVELLRLTLQMPVSRDRLPEVIRRRGADLMLLIDYRHGRPRALAADELQGRVSGSAEWRSARGEIGTAGARAPPPALPPKPAAAPSGWIAVRPGVFDLQANGHAKLRQGPFAMQLTPNEADKCGSIFTKATFALQRGFLCQFEFELERSGDGADGFAFVMHQAPMGAQAIGNPGCQLGYGGIPQSVAVELDCYQNSDLANDPNACHISVQTRWERENSAHHDYSLACCTDPTGQGLRQFPAHRRYLVRILYDAVDQQLSIGCDEASSSSQAATWTPKLSLPFTLRPLAVQSRRAPSLVNVPDHLLSDAQRAAKRGQASASDAPPPPPPPPPAADGGSWHVGFTGSTGGLSQAHVVHSLLLHVCP